MAEIAAVGIVKRYGGLIANAGVNLSAEPGEIHGVMGENGAGKTTLMSVLFGLQAPDAGEIRVRDSPVRFRSPIDAMTAGLGMVHQSFKLFGSLTAWENIVYGAELRRGPFVDRRSARQRDEGPAPQLSAVDNVLPGRQRAEELEGLMHHAQARRHRIDRRTEADRRVAHAN